MSARAQAGCGRPRGEPAEGRAWARAAVALNPAAAAVARACCRSGGGSLLPRQRWRWRWRRAAAAACVSGADGKLVRGAGAGARIGDASCAGTCPRSGQRFAHGTHAGGKGTRFSAARRRANCGNRGAHGVRCALAHLGGAPEPEVSSAVRRARSHSRHGALVALPPLSARVCFSNAALVRSATEGVRAAVLRAGDALSSLALEPAPLKPGASPHPTRPPPPGVC